MKRSIIILLCSLLLPAGLSAQVMWPGDTDNNGIANHHDILNIGLGYGDQGSARAQQGIIWQAYILPQQWADTLPSNLPSSFADCDGNGQVNSIDIQAIQQNYGQIHGTYIPDTTTPGGPNAPPMTFVLTQDSVNGGNTVTVDIHLGDSTQSMDSLYGIAFAIEFDSTLIDSIYSDFGGSWLSQAAPSCQAFFDVAGAGLQFTFTDNSVPNGVIVNYTWDFGDGNTSTGPGLSSVTHSYLTAGIYQVCLIISTQDSCNSTICRPVIAGNTQQCLAHFNSSANGNTVSFSDLSASSDSITSWSWDFGDGSVSTQPNSVHSYAAAGFYTICLTISSGTCTSTTCDSILIGGPSLLTISHLDTVAGQLQIGMTRTDRLNISGQGKLGSIIVVLEENLKTYDNIWELLELSFFNVKAINTSGSQLSLFPINDTLYINFNETDKPEIQKTQLLIFPNPARNWVKLQSQNLQIPGLDSGEPGILLTDMNGRNISVPIQIQNDGLLLNLQSLPKGIYFLRVKTSQGIATRKLLIQ